MPHFQQPAHVTLLCHDAAAARFQRRRRLRPQISLRSHADAGGAQSATSYSHRMGFLPRVVGQTAESPAVDLGKRSPSRLSSSCRVAGHDSPDMPLAISVKFISSPVQSVRRGSASLADYI
jgi:hypothetical protein